MFKYTIIAVIASIVYYIVTKSEFVLFTEVENTYQRAQLYIFESFLSKYLDKDSSQMLNGAKELADDELLFTPEELNGFSGKDDDGGPIYLAILGRVFDVSKGAKFYGPGEGYHSFAGRDASKAFITGDFTEQGLTDDVTELSLQELRGLKDWLNFYHKDYSYQGKLIGRYYDSSGGPTSYHNMLKERFEEAEREKNAADNDKLKFPPCNVEWSQDSGSRVWCSKRSGGVEREWLGVPRKYFQPGTSSYRCACVNTASEQHLTTGRLRQGNLEEYIDCHPKASSCYIVAENND